MRLGLRRDGHIDHLRRDKAASTKQRLHALLHVRIELSAFLLRLECVDSVDARACLVVFDYLQQPAAERPRLGVVWVGEQ